MEKVRCKSKHAQDLNPENYKILMKEIKDINKRRQTMFTDEETQHSKGTILSKLTYRLYTYRLYTGAIYDSSCQYFVYTLTRLFQNSYRGKETKIAKTI